MNAIIVSDLHLGSRYFQSEAFAGFPGIIPDVDEPILNGAVLDRPHAELAPSHQQTLDRIEQLSFRHKAVWVRGNHDYGYMPARLGNIEFCRRYTFDHRILITHGDDFDTIMPRSRVFMKAFRLMHDLRVRLVADSERRRILTTIKTRQSTAVDHRPKVVTASAKAIHLSDEIDGQPYCYEL